MNSKFLGIDLGTTNSCMAIMLHGRAEVIPNAEGHRSTPSIVAFTESGVELVGQAAQRQAVTNPQNTIHSVKRFLGRKYDEFKHELHFLPYKLVKAANGDAHIEVKGQVFSPMEISAKILKKLKLDAEAHIGEIISKVVIAVPAHFDYAQRQATKAAGRVAGFETTCIVSSPVAAAIAYGLDKKKDEKICVYDLGGGSFNVAVLELGDGVYEVKATSGDTYLGGDDLDGAIVHRLIVDFKSETGIDLKQNACALQRLKEAAEKAKCELSLASSTEINLPFIAADSSGPKHLTQTLTRAKLDELGGILIERTIFPVKQCLKDAGLSSDELDAVLMIGGMSRMPKAIEAAKSLTGNKPHGGVNPDEIVAIGAAIQGGIFKGEVTDVLFLDVLPISIGVETQGGVFTKMIERNTTIPTNKTEVCSFPVNEQNEVVIDVFQGERALTANNTNLGTLRLKRGMPSAFEGAPTSVKIEVTMDIDAHQTIYVTAKDPRSGQEQRIII
ncbi:MAG: molecular chaperone DnaK [Verrucomicrobiota bacterium]|jgi:molecular chaperone DnaK